MTVSLEPGRLRSTSAASSAPACAEPRDQAWLAPRMAERHGITGNLAPVPRCLHHGAGFRRPFTTRVQDWMARPRRILGRACGSLRMNTWTGRRSSSSATRTALEHDHVIARSPARTFEAAHPACAGLGGNLRTGLGPRPPRRPSTPGDIGHPRRCKPFGLRATALPDASRGFTSQGPAGSRRPTPLAAARKQATELCPDPIRSDTSRHETAAVPEGEPDTERRSAEAVQRIPCVLASQADPHD
jgi:hypothetical protein